MTQMLTRPVEEPQMQTAIQEFTHIVAQNLPGNDITTAIVTGTTVVALCGHVFTPYRDPKNFPVCRSCTDEYGRLMTLIDSTP